MRNVNVFERKMELRAGNEFFYERISQSNFPSTQK